MARLSVFFILCVAVAVASCSFEKKKEDQNILIIHVKLLNKQANGREILELYLPPEMLTSQRRESRNDARIFESKDKKDCLLKNRCIIKINGKCLCGSLWKNYDQNHGKRTSFKPGQVHAESDSL